MEGRPRDEAVELAGILRTTRQTSRVEVARMIIIRSAAGRAQRNPITLRTSNSRPSNNKISRASLLTDVYRTSKLRLTRGTRSRPFN